MQNPQAVASGGLPFPVARQKRLRSWHSNLATHWTDRGTESGSEILDRRR
jgi:hypothetical protein